MMHRYFLIEPSYTDLDTFCNFTVGSGRVRANIQIYADDSMLAGVVFAASNFIYKNIHLIIRSPLIGFSTCNWSPG